MTVKTFHDVYHSEYGDGPFGDKLDKVAVAELQKYLEAKTISNYQISHTVERDKYGRLHTHILLVCE
jgi:hypothetical protein